MIKKIVKILLPITCAGYLLFLIKKKKEDEVMGENLYNLLDNHEYSESHSVFIADNWLNNSHFVERTLQCSDNEYLAFHHGKNKKCALCELDKFKEHSLTTFKNEQNTTHVLKR